MCSLVSTPLNETFSYDQMCAYSMNSIKFNGEAQMFLISGADHGRRTYTDENMDYITVSRDGYVAEGSVGMPKNTMSVSATQIR